MKKVLFSLVALFAAVVASAQDYQNKEYFVGSEIAGLVVSGNMDVQISQGSQTGVWVTIDPAYVDRFNVSITEDMYARIEYREDLKAVFSKKNKPVCKVVVSSLRYLSINGSSVIGKGTFSCASTFSALMWGGSFLSFVKIESEKSVWDIKGGAKVEDCTIEAPVMVEVTADETSSSNLKINTENLIATAKGAALLTLSGEVSRNTKVSANSTVTVDILKVNTPMIDATALGMSKIKATVTGTANVTCGGTASFRYVGNGTVNGDSKNIKPM
ncbi:hypothetical protein BN938_2094 [Mucinivorans hirudinis]|uniref:Putative auto-transporter adhesin head GIN domain-containing protein n=1 Tax=Mucinivorans hirudinis TaxID=1433126 RepID=A0A060R9B9_9BACT|nr:hypothetical protein BN938_2094 [Mucinivorans hirudinis]